MQAMINDVGMEVLIIKVSSMGLWPDKHLGMRLYEIWPEMLRLVPDPSQFTLATQLPLPAGKRLRRGRRVRELDPRLPDFQEADPNVQTPSHARKEYEVIMHDDKCDDAQVAYMKIKQAVLIEKPAPFDENSAQEDEFDLLGIPKSDPGEGSGFEGLSDSEDGVGMGAEGGEAEWGGEYPVSTEALETGIKTSEHAGLTQTQIRREDRGSP